MTESTAIRSQPTSARSGRPTAHGDRPQRPSGVVRVEYPLVSVTPGEERIVGHVHSDHVEQVDQIAPRAMFLIYAPRVDNGDEERFNRAYYQKAGRPKAIWGVPEAGHVGAQDARPREYEQRITAFFDQALRKEQP
jgi:fermentation-respiration switch protein FrsA (DUF1100 family)